MNRIFISFILVSGSLTVCSADLITQYDFNNSLAPTVNTSGTATAKNSEAVYPPTGTSGTVTPTYSQQSVGTTTKSVLDMNPYGELRMVSGLSGNGFKYPQVYTIVEDVRLDRATAFNLLTNQSTNYGDEQSAYINKNGYAGLSYLAPSDPIPTDSQQDADTLAYAKGTVYTDVTQWHRYALSVDLTNNLASIYVDGSLALSCNSVPSIQALNLTKQGNAITLFGSTWDSLTQGNLLRDGYGGGEHISSLSFYDTALNADQVKALGSLQAVPEPSTMAFALVGLVRLARSRKQKTK